MKVASQSTNAEQEIVELEKQWNAAIQRQDVSQMDRFLADSYFLAIGVQALPLQIVPRAHWLETLHAYKIEDFSFDDMRVNVYGDVAVVLMLYTQEATVRGQDRSGQLVITDVWVKGDGGWRVAERHSSRPEPKTVARPE